MRFGDVSEVVGRFVRSAAFIALVTLLAVNLLLAFVPGRNVFAELRDPDRFVWYSKVALLRGGPVDTPENSPPVDTIILGDSQAMSGIVPEILDRALGSRSVNLGLPSQQPEGLLALARYIPETLPGVRRVIVNVNPFSLFKTEVVQSFTHYYRAELARYSLEPAAPGEMLHQALLRAPLPLYETNYILAPVLGFGEAGLSDFTFAQIRSNPGLLTPATYAKYLAGERPGLWPLLQARRERNQRLAELLRQQRGFWTWKHFEQPRFDPAVCANAPARPDLEIRTARGVFAYPPRPAAIKAYRELFAYLRDRKYEIWLVQIPFSPAYGNLVNEELVYQNVDQAVAMIVGAPGDDRIGGGVIPLPQKIPAARAALPVTGAFVDLTHLSACGAADYTRWLAGELARRSGK